MKILIIRSFPDKINLYSYNSQEVGLAKALVKKGHSCDVVLYNEKENDRVEDYNFSYAGKEFKFKIYWMHGIGILKNGFMPSVKKIIFKYDIIQVHEYDQIMSWNLYTKQLRPTVIYHGPYSNKFTKGYNLKCKIFDRFFLPMRNYSNTTVITKSTLAAKFLFRKGFRNITTIGVGLDIDNFGRDIEYDIADENSNTNKQILYVGKLEKRRNLYFLVDIFRKLRQKDHEYKFIIIGNGEKHYKEKFLNSIEKEIREGIIEYKEKIEQKELVKYYRTSSFFLLASQYEIFGMVLLEAMYFGTPVISSINGGSTTLIKNNYNGFVIEAFNSDEWVKCILDTMRDGNKIKEMKENARRTIEENFKWDNIVDKFIEIYTNILK